ncbi:TPA: glycosyltransferase family 4 protein [Clostridium perfringens]|uniref:glycosyltransferase n=1 Tax=Clostridium perfringens TaxID=1502 RepID=UPI001A32F0FE|nr:glycosyltransferase family 4 protein [Clostridium perfringens]
MKRIDIFIHSLKGGGAERVCVTLANEFVKKGIKTRIIMLYSEGAKYTENLSDLVELISLNNKKNTFECLKNLNRYLKNENLDKVFVFNNNIAIIMMIFKKIYKYRYKVISRNINTLTLEKKHEKSLFKKYVLHNILSFLYRKVDYCICQSKGMAEDLIENYNFDKNKISIINNPVSDKFDKFKIKEYKGKNEILFVGRIEDQKGIHMLIAAFSMVLNKIPNAHLKIVGEGSLKEELVKKSEELKIKEKIIWKDFSKDIESIYKNASVVVLSSYFEGFPNVLVEAITIGLPVVSFDCPSGPSEIIVNGVNGYLVDYLNVKELSEALINALNKEWNILDIQKTSLRFNRENISQKYLDVIEKFDLENVRSL